MQEDGNPERLASNALFKRHRTRHRGVTFRVKADGTRSYAVYAQGRYVAAGTTEKEALAKQAEIRSRSARGERVIVPKRLTFEQVAEEWFASKRKLRPWTRKCYRDALDLVLIPRFGKWRIGQVDTESIAQLIRDLDSEGLHSIDPKRPKRALSASSVENYCTPLAGVLAFAVRRAYVGSNPFLALTNDDRPEKRDVEPAHEWSDEEIDALLEASELIAQKPESQYDYALLIRAAVFTGLRLGELLGLQWGDVDFDESVLHVRRQATRTGELAPPKTKKGIRRVPLSPDLVKRLRLHKVGSDFSQEGDLVFAAKSGKPLSHRNVQRRAFEPARNLAELPKTVTFHDLRHAFASLAAHRGVPVNVLSEVLGHSDVGVTQKVYLHLYGREKAEEAFRTAMAGGAL